MLRPNFGEIVGWRAPDESSVRLAVDVRPIDDAVAEAGRRLPAIKESSGEDVVVIHRVLFVRQQLCGYTAALVKVERALLEDQRHNAAVYGSLLRPDAT